MATVDGHERCRRSHTFVILSSTYSDSSLHYAMMPTVVAHYHARLENENNGMLLAFRPFPLQTFFCCPSTDHMPNFDMNDTMEPSTYSLHQHHLQVSNSHFPQHHQLDLNHSLHHNYANGRTNVHYPSSQVPTQGTPATSLAAQTIGSSSNHAHAALGPRYSGGSTGSNVLMLPPNHHPRGGSLPDLRTGNAFHPQQSSFSTTPSPPTSVAQHFFRSSSPQENGDGDLYVLVRTFLPFHKH